MCRRILRHHIYSIERRTVWKWFSSQIIWRGDKVLLARVETAVYLLRNIIFCKWKSTKTLYLCIIPHNPWFFSRYYTIYRVRTYMRYCNYFIVLTVWIYLIRFLSIMIKVYWFTMRRIWMIMPNNNIWKINKDCGWVSDIATEHFNDGSLGMVKGCWHGFILCYWKERLKRISIRMEYFSKRFSIWISLAMVMHIL